MSKNILVIGGTGMAGSRIVKEASDRGHNVTIGSRKSSEGRTVSIDVFDLTSIKNILTTETYDVIVCAHGPIRKFENGEMIGADTEKRYIKTVQNILQAVREAGLTNDLRLCFVGGAGSLLMENGETVESQPWFPANVKEEANQHTETLQFLRTFQDVNDFQWTYLSPPGFFMPGERTGNFIVGKDHVLNSNNSISSEDYAIVLVDEIEKNEHLRERFTCAHP